MIRHERWLLALTGLFAVRVAAPPLQQVAELPLLPPFEAWHSGAVPYGHLLAVQIGLLTAMLWTVKRVRDGRIAATWVKAGALLGLGSLYFAGMSFRLVAGQSFLADNAWFAAWLPSLFHIVLALFVILLGHYHLVRAGQLYREVTS